MSELEGSTSLAQQYASVQAHISFMKIFQEIVASYLGSATNLDGKLLAQLQGINSELTGILMSQPMGESRPPELPSGVTTIVRASEERKAA